MQTIVGVNAAGKSNLFDALLLLRATTQQDLMTAYGQGRGDIHEYFTQTVDDYAQGMTLEADLLLPHTVVDDWGERSRITFNRLTYSVAIRREDASSGRSSLAVQEEWLRPIQRKSDDWAKRFLRGDAKHWLPRIARGRSAFISTEGGSILLHPDGHGGRLTRAPGPTRSILSGVSNAEFPHALAAKQALGKIILLQLDPNRMRMPSSFDAPDTLTPSGENLAAVLARLDRDVPKSLRDITTETAAVVDGFADLSVDQDTARRLYTIRARHGGDQHSAQVLSDGTLRAIALAALKYDPLYGGTLLLEEPENGVHPGRLEKIASLLKALPSNLGAGDPDEWPRQVVVNTHSPKFMAEMMRENLALIVPVSALSNGQTTRRSRLIRIKDNPPVLPPHEGDGYIARHEVERMLETESLERAIASLRQASL